VRAASPVTWHKCVRQAPRAPTAPGRIEPAAMSVDTIVVGGGSAGCCVAARLSEDPDHRVLVLEAGRRDAWYELLLHMPAGLSRVLGNPRYDWRYSSEPEPFMGGRRIAHARGKVLGGSSSINGMIFVRGHPGDFDGWAQAEGMEGWSWEGCLPWFRTSETALWGDPALRGHSGPLELELGPCTNPLFGAFFEAMAQAGYPRAADYNGGAQEGHTAFDRNIRKGTRLSAARAYLHPVLARPNLSVRTGCQTARVLLEGTRAVGVELLNGERLLAGRVVLCAGAIGSPQLLQVSGVGPEQVLREAEVPVLHDLPGVGENLQDHLEVYVQHACAQPVSVAPALRWWNQPWIGLEWLLTRTGPAATNHFEAGGFLKTTPEAPYPDLQLHFLPLAVRYDGSSPVAGHGYQIHAGPNLAEARGWVRIRSGDVREHPRLQFNYLSTERDRRAWVTVVRKVREILDQPAFQPFSDGEISPGPEVTSDDDILAWVAQDAETALHPSCTCKMGRDALSVVDPDDLSVHGLQGLHVVDASVMPSITNGNLYAPTMMIAEKASAALRS